MKPINCINKKVGIWGLGVVGQSALRYLQDKTPHIQILDKNKQDLSAYPLSSSSGLTRGSMSQNNISVILQTPETIRQFLEHNDIIIASPGIILTPYQKTYGHKFICELDIFAQNFKHKTIAITGTVGKTTITNLLSQATANSVAAGNIGFAMLDLLTQNMQKTAVLELSSYQLHYTHSFAPDLAIWTNFFANHLDHHASEKEYFDAKCNLLARQTKNHIALLPAHLISKIQKSVTVHARIYLFASRKPRKAQTHPLFFIHKNNIMLAKHSAKITIFKGLDQLPDLTFTQNWLIIIAALHLQHSSLDNFVRTMQQLPAQKHRIEFVRTLSGCAMYNDSKSTVWQATHGALKKFKNKKIALFLGGLSKGTDRLPLIKKLNKNNVTVFAFGAEKQIIADLCAQHKVICLVHETMQESVQGFLQHQSNFNVLLFSPAGASLDQFKNYEDRGEQFKEIINQL